MRSYKVCELQISCLRGLYAYTNTGGDYDLLYKLCVRYWTDGASHRDYGPRIQRLLNST